MTTPAVSLYLHIPFCRHRCAYCDFNTYAGQEQSIPAYVEALAAEIRLVGESGARPRVGTIFFGGGTPSLLDQPQYDAIFAAIRQAFSVDPAAEISLEANPGTTSPAYLQALARLGFNRISFGVQSANAEELRMLERIHDFPAVVQALRDARRAGFQSINLDLIYGLPEQRLARWQDTVRRSVALQPEHISAYALTLEHGTPFGRWAARGLLPLPDPDLAAEMYEWTGEFLAAEGYEQYEISNWAWPGHECRHNLQYWRGQDYLGLGAGAHGYVGGMRYANVLRIKTYIDRLQPPRAPGSYPLGPAAVSHHRNTQAEDMGEAMMTGLRLTREGVPLQAFAQRFGQQAEQVFGREIAELVALGLLERHADCLRLTARGRLLGNQVFMRFV